MGETIVRGVIIGLAFMALGVVATVIWKVIRSPSEGARRLRWVVGGGLALLIASLLVQGLGVIAVLALAAILGAITWIIRGFRKP